MGLDELHLRVLAMASDDPKQKANAQKGIINRIFLGYILTYNVTVLKLMNKGRHWVLVVRQLS
jgi:hypothetical protein